MKIEEGRNEAAQMYDSIGAACWWPYPDHGKDRSHAGVPSLVPVSKKVTYIAKLVSTTSNEKT